MGLFNRNKKEKQVKWFINKTPGNVELMDNFIKITINLPKTENIVFYKDIHDIKKGKKFVKITSKTDEYSLGNLDKDIVEETYLKILEKVSESVT
jgi:hypothetical protein